ncbi:hypothetical protein [Methylobacterium platani]|uniref:DUF4019 domain-containing protein n=2 Tax=Methylobacterium platani TaxID=427683 RepID=A0A179SA41_9HYPH|nr:hypothetical protein [Methylobacterium platani]KMO21504.1 hypothetical protein SQ03_02980 [Methylobacterium platani JCM 14648]OAS24283.1 hypothetical protein A5481_14585 [Methylobacterium platani]
MRPRPTALGTVLGTVLGVAALAAATLPGPARAQAQEQGRAQAQEGVQPPLPAQADALVAYVTKAINDHDIAAFERLVNWSGTRAQRKRLTLYQIRSGFGRPIRQASLEPMPEDGLADATSRGTLKANMPVTERLRVVFDEPPVEGDAPPTSVFLVGREAGAYRIALLVPTGPPRGK